MADREGSDLTAPRRLRPRHLSAETRRASRLRWKAPRAASVATLKNQTMLPAAAPEGFVVDIEYGPWMRHRCRITAPAGSVTAPQTKTLSQLRTWLTAVPRSWRT